MNPLLLPLVPLVAAGAVAVMHRRPRDTAVIAVAALVATAFVGASAALSGASLSVAWSPVVELVLAVDDFGGVMAVLVPVIAAPIVAYAAVTTVDGQARLLSLLLAFVAAMLLLVVAADFITLLIAWELIGAVSWTLIGHAWRQPSNVAAATQAFVTTRLGDLGLYVAAGAVFAGSGSFAFAGLAGLPAPWFELVAGGVLLAAAAKSAQLPFSPWLFAAMAGPTAVSALLHSATLVAAGAYLLIRLTPVLGAVAWFLPLVAAVGVATALAGGLVATLQTHAKRVLAASTSAQFGLVFIAVGAGSTVAAAAHLVTHAAFKPLLFLGAGVAIHATGTAALGRHRLGRVLPVVAALSAVGALALAGVPPLGAAWSKEQILAAALAVSPALGFTVLATALLSALYAGRYALLAFGPGVRDTLADLPRPGAVEVAALAVLAALTIGLGVLWLPGADRVVEELARGTMLHTGVVAFTVSLAVVAIAGLALAVLARQRRLLGLGLDDAFRERLADWLGLPQLTDRLVARPTMQLAYVLARGDDRVIDAGVRGAARIGQLVSGLASRRIELSIDRFVRAVAAATQRTATGSRVADDVGVDGVVESAGRGIGIAGHHSRRLQTGLAHHYYVIVAVGLGLIAAILALGR